VFENSADNIRKAYRQSQANYKTDSPLPAELAPYEIDNKQVERNPHRSTRYGRHYFIHHCPTIKIEPEK
jgi:hypothetical protein